MNTYETYIGPQGKPSLNGTVQVAYPVPDSDDPKSCEVGMGTMGPGPGSLTSPEIEIDLTMGPVGSYWLKFRLKFRLKWLKYLKCELDIFGLFGLIWPFPCSSLFSSRRLLVSGLNNGGRQLCYPLEPSKSIA